MTISLARRAPNLGTLLAVATIAALAASCGDDGPNVTATSSAAPPATSLVAVATATTLSFGAELVEAQEAYGTAYDACGADPASCRVETLAVLDSPASRNLSELMAKFAANGWRVRPGPKPSYYVIEKTDVRGDGSATLTVCSADFAITYKPADGGAAETVIDDRVISSRGMWTYVRDADRWRLREVKSVGEWIGENKCPAKS